MRSTPMRPREFRESVSSPRCRSATIRAMSAVGDRGAGAGAAAGEAATEMLREAPMTRPRPMATAPTWSLRIMQQVPMSPMNRFRSLRTPSRMSPCMRLATYNPVAMSNRAGACRLGPAAPQQNRTWRVMSIRPALPRRPRSADAKLPAPSSLPRKMTPPGRPAKDGGSDASQAHRTQRPTDCGWNLAGTPTMGPLCSPSESGGEQ